MAEYQYPHGWEWVRYDTLVDVHPVNDTKEHGIGDECWCNPSVVREPGYLPLVSHNSADKREFSEPDNWAKQYLVGGW